MTFTEWMDRLLGPAGALVLALIVLRYQAVAAAAARRELRDSYEQRIRELSTQLDREQRESQAARSELEAEHRERLRDARRTTATLLELTGRVHTAIDAVQMLYRSATPGPVHPPAE